MINQLELLPKPYSKPPTHEWVSKVWVPRALKNIESGSRKFDLKMAEFAANKERNRKNMFTVNQQQARKWGKK